jgi:hypothetical protein
MQKQFLVFVKERLAFGCIYKQRWHVGLQLHSRREARTASTNDPKLLDPRD